MAQQRPDEQFLVFAGGSIQRFGGWLLTSGPADWALVGVGVGTVVAALRTLKAIQTEVEATAKSAAAAEKNAEIASRMLALSHQKERAYVTMSHYPPGLREEAFVGSTSIDPVDRRTIQIQLKIENTGNTPATVTAHLVQIVFTDEPLPPVPVYEATSVRVVRMPVVNSGHFDVTVRWNVEEAALRRVRTEESWELYVLGFVDYIDAFGIRHRSGYARRWDPHADQRNRLFVHAEGRVQELRDPASANNNLPFVTQMAYNYDRERQPDEGNDWK